MSRAISDYEHMSFDDFEESLADMPRNERWELIGGRVFRAMVGAHWEHAQIVGNLSRHLGNEFERGGSSCRVFTDTFYMKLKSVEAQLLPDVMVVCGELEPGATSTDEPVVIIEVLSVGTESRDRMADLSASPVPPALRAGVARGAACRGVQPA